MAASGNAWQDRQHFNPGHKATTPNTSAAPSPGTDNYNGNIYGGNIGGRSNHNAIFQAEGGGLETTLGRIEAMLSNGSNIEQDRAYHALADLSSMKKKLDEMVKKRDKFEAQIKQQLGIAR
ncbi:hypothetical protein PC9H_008259 [Pleurotus ostreatus]|uniref:Uncharacterized protein n=2 Tax=Pleurotus ostreatus TaxID=5322 RepID=A0A067NWI9_PLEO1|nr:uncharacterized protein PC9H_008259 [Pleurotus ostreatus]KAF7429021.1 hypothetical protein PC9H_008259 [Pleurotus ostreatus]KDQ28512.1 hypothetical protein PLEOSDRAFT_1105164 [Pleurotus ostreatus PC15]